MEKKPFDLTVYSVDALYGIKKRVEENIKALKATEREFRLYDALDEEFKTRGLIAEWLTITA